MKFYDSDAFYRTVNKWVRDGSTIISILTVRHSIYVGLRGKDGGTEVLVLHLSTEAYHADEENMPAAV